MTSLDAIDDDMGSSWLYSDAGLLIEIAKWNDKEIALIPQNNY